MRVLREEWGGSKRTMMHNRAAAAKKAQDAQAQAARAAAAGGQASGEATNPAAAQPASSAAGADGDIEMKEVKDENAGTAAKPGSQNGSVPPPSAASVPTATPRAPNEMLEEINNMLKTAFPLLALMMERMVDHISIRAKPNSEEDIYRFFAALLNDAMQVSRVVSSLRIDAYTTAMVWSKRGSERRRRVGPCHQGELDQVCPQPQRRVESKSQCAVST